MVVLEKTFGASWTARRSNQSIPKEISPEYSLEGLMLKLKLQYFDHLMGRILIWKKPWCWATLKAGGEGDGRGWDAWMATLTWWTWIWASPGVGDGQGSLACCSPWDHRVGHDWVTEQICKSGDYWLHLLVTSDINSIINHSLNIYWALFRYWNPAVNKGKTPALMNLPSSGKRSA